MTTDTHSNLPVFEDFGSGPAIILLHSFEQSRLDSERARLAACGHRIILVEATQKMLRASSPQAISRALLELLNYLGAGRALLIVDGPTAPFAPEFEERLVAILRIGQEQGACPTLADALVQAKGVASVRRTPLQRLNRRLTGLFNALLPPDDSATGPLHQEL